MIHIESDLQQRMVELVKQFQLTCCVCFVCDGIADEFIVGVTDFATAETWRRHDTAHRAFMTFEFGKMEEVEADEGDETQ